MLDLTDPQPNPVRSLHLRNRSNEQLLKSFNYLFGITRKVLPEETNLAGRVLADLDPNRKICAFTHVYHSLLTTALREKRKESVRNALAGFTTSSEQRDRTAVTVLRKDEHLDQFIGLISHGSQQSYGTTLNIQPWVIGNDKACENALHTALIRWREVDPEGFQEYSDLVTDVILIPTESMNSLSSHAALGAIGLSNLKPAHRWTRYFEEIVHETAHIYLFHVSLEGALFNIDSNTLYSSPLRSDPRPIRGIFHAAFVLARILRVINLLKRSADYNPVEDAIDPSINNRKNALPFEDKFNDAYATLLESGHLSDRGLKLLTNAYNMAFEHNPTHA